MVAIEIIPGSLRDRLLADARGAAREFRLERYAQMTLAQYERDFGRSPRLVRARVFVARLANRKLVGALREIRKLEGRS